MHICRVLVWSVRSSKVQLWQVLYIAGNFRGRKLSWIRRSENFTEKTFTDCLKQIIGGVACPQISRRKLSRMALKPRNPQKFSPSKVSRYTVVKEVGIVKNTILILFKQKPHLNSNCPQIVATPGSH